MKFSRTRCGWRRQPACGYRRGVRSEGRPAGDDARREFRVHLVRRLLRWTARLRMGSEQRRRGFALQLSGRHIRGDPSGFELGSNGLIGGVEAGYGWQADNLYFGVEADASAAGIKGTHTDTASAYSLDSTLQWLSTARVRVGLPVDRFLLFASGGLAVGGHTGRPARQLRPGRASSIPPVPARMGMDRRRGRGGGAFGSLDRQGRIPVRRSGVAAVHLRRAHRAGMVEDHQQRADDGQHRPGRDRLPVLGQRAIRRPVRAQAAIRSAAASGTPVATIRPAAPASARGASSSARKRRRSTGAGISSPPVGAALKPKRS